MKKCKHCQSEIDSKAKICPNCRKKQGFPVWLGIILIILGMGLIGSALGGTYINEPSNNNDKTNTSVNQEKFILEEGHVGSLDEYGVGYYINGYIKNNTNKEYSYVQVTFNLYDKDGNQLGTAVDNINNLEANGRWKFKAIALSETDSIASYKLAEITGF